MKENIFGVIKVLLYFAIIILSFPILFLPDDVLWGWGGIWKLILGFFGAVAIILWGQKELFGEEKEEDLEESIKKHFRDLTEEEEKEITDLFSSFIEKRIKK